MLCRRARPLQAVPERFEEIFKKHGDERALKDAAEAAARDAVHEEEARLQLQPDLVAPPLAPESGPAPGNSGDPVRQVRLDVPPPAESSGATPAEGSMDVEIAQEASPTWSWKRERDDTPESSKQRRIGHLEVCSISQVGRGSDDDGYDEPAVDVAAAPESAPITPEMHRGVAMTEYEVPIPEKVMYGTRSGDPLDPVKVQAGRQKEYDSILGHGVEELVRVS